MVSPHRLTIVLAIVLPAPSFLPVPLFSGQIKKRTQTPLVYQEIVHVRLQCTVLQVRLSQDRLGGVLESDAIRVSGRHPNAR